MPKEFDFDDDDISGADDSDMSLLDSYLGEGGTEPWNEPTKKDAEKAKEASTKEKIKETVEPAIANGIHKGMSNKEYHAIDGMSSTRFSIMKKSQRAYKHRDLFAYSTPSFSLGDLRHTSILEPHRLETEYLESSTLTVDSVASTNLANANPDKIVVGRGMIETSRIVSKRVHSVFGEFIDGSDKEVSIFYNCPHTGLLFKIRCDMLFKRPDGKYIIFDIKNSKENTQKGFEFSIESYDYDLQASWYKDVARLAGLDVVAFGWIVVPSTEPNVPFGMLCSEELEVQGRTKYTDLINEYVEYKKSGADDRLFQQAHGYRYKKGLVDEHGEEIGES